MKTTLPQETPAAKVVALRRSGSVMPWTRNCIFKIRCVISEMRALGKWVDGLAMPDSDPKELAKYSKAMKRDLRRNYWRKLRSLAKELPLALVLDTPIVGRICRAWMRRKHSRNTELTGGSPVQ